MGVVTSRMCWGDRVQEFYKAEAFFFDVLVRVHCEHRLGEKSDLRFYLKFEQKTSMGSPRRVKISDQVFEKIMEISKDFNPDDRERILNRAHAENLMSIVRPKPFSFMGFRCFKKEVLKTLEELEKIFQSLASPYGSVMELSIFKGERVSI
mgnify:CR=1 FL=1